MTTSFRYVILTYVAERCIALAERHMERTSPESRSVLQQIRDVLCRSLSSIGARVACRGRHSTMIGRHVSIELILSSRSRISSRGAKWVKRGAKRRAIERLLRDERLSQQQEEVQELEVGSYIPLDIGTSGAGPSQPEEYVIQEVVVCNICPYRHRRTTDRYTSG